MLGSPCKPAGRGFDPTGLSLPLGTAPMPAQPPEPLPEPWLLLACPEIQGTLLTRTKGNNGALFSSGDERGVEEGKGEVTWAVPQLQTRASSLGKHHLSVVEPQGAANPLPALPFLVQVFFFLPAPISNSNWDLQFQPRTVLCTVEGGTVHSLFAAPFDVSDHLSSHS